jgi:nitrite reductase/ring-hydroxylating ferredoxin subunit
MRHRLDPSLLQWDDIAPAEVGGRRIAVGRVGDRYFALDDTCPHAGCSLAQGELDGDVLMCVCHGSEFDVATGQVLGGPANGPVTTYQISVEGDDLWVEV